MFVVFDSTRFLLGAIMTYIFDASKLLQLRKEKLWTQEDLAAASGVSVRTIQRMERDGRGSVESWKAIAAAFDVKAESLLLKPIHVIENVKHQEDDMKRAVTGAILGCASGLLGCAYAWSVLLSKPVGFHGAIEEYPLLTAIVTVSTAVVLIVPIMTWKRTLKN